MSETQDMYLPAAAELDQMSREEFWRWVIRMKQELPKMAERRDPLLYLQKRISNVLGNRELTEEQREFHVLCEMERFERIRSSSR